MTFVLKDELHIHTMSLDRTHLSHAIDLMRMAKNYFGRSPSPSERELAKRFILSSIIHAFSGLESVVNLLGFELFSNPDSQKFIPLEQRDFLLKRLAKSWDVVPSIDKISFILSHSSKTSLPAPLENKLRELNILRNWLVHGFSYKKTFLLEPKNSGTYNVVDTEDSVDWAKKFPNTKFKPLNDLDVDDAILALTIVFETLKLLSDSVVRPLSLLTCVPEQDYQILFMESFDIQGILK